MDSTAQYVYTPKIKPPDSLNKTSSKSSTNYEYDLSVRRRRLAQSERSHITYRVSDRRTTFVVVPAKYGIVKTVCL